MLTPFLWPVYAIAAAGLVLSILVLVFVIRGWYRWASGRFRAGEGGALRRRPGAVATALSLMAALTLASLGVAGVALAAALAGYQALAEETQAAVVLAEPAPETPGRFMLTYVPVVDGARREDLRRVRVMDGDQWRIEGHFLRWSGWARLLGLKTCFRLTRVDGRFSSAAEAARRPATVVDLGGEDSWLWRQLRAHGGQLPGIECAQGGGAFTEPAARTEFEVLATPGGFVIRKSGRPVTPPAR